MADLRLTAGHRFTRMPTPLTFPAPSREISPHSTAAFCWVPQLAPSRNQFVSFERRFRLTEIGDASIRLFADSRFRLFINETFIAYGPGRFVTASPEFDEYEIGDALVVGENLIRVEVNYYGSSSFQTMPDGQPGFIADGSADDGGVSFTTPGEWRSRIHHAWDAQAPHFSFAQNPAEICDTRLLAGELAARKTLPLVTLPPGNLPWNKPVPRTAPYPDYALRRPARLAIAGPVVPSQRWGVQLRHPCFKPEERKAKPCYVSFVTWINSPREQTVTMDCLWADLILGGTPVQTRYPGFLGNHGEASLALQAGWNFLSGSIELLQEHWPLLLGFPPEAGLSLHALPSHDCQDAFALSPPGGESRPWALSSPADFALPPRWRAVPNDIPSVTPARLIAWDQVDPGHARKRLPAAQFSDAATFTGPSALWSYDFADEYYGQPVIEVEAPAGTILDVAYDDWQRSDGCVNLYHSNPFTNAADRFILRGGRQKIEVLNPRGGIFLQLILRAPAGSPSAKLTVHDIAIRRRTTIVHASGSFACGDPVLDWAWCTSVHTLQSSTDEAYADCPWRERGSYIGDTLVNLHLHRLISTDLSVARRTIGLFGAAQLPNGQLLACAPSWLARCHCDFTLLWIQAVHDLWAFTGDSAFVETQWPVIQRIFSNTAWKVDARGLWDTTGEHAFVDWGSIPSERNGPGNAVINILRVAALRSAARLAEVLRKSSIAARYRNEADRVAETLIACLWDKARGRFNANIGAETPAVHANVLALRHGIGPSDQILAYLEPRLRDNFDAALNPETAKNGFIELYFFHHLLPALAAHGKTDLAEKLIEQTYGFLKSFGHPTLVENFQRAHDGKGSCCHSWSGSPAVYSTAYILGLRQASPGDPDAFVLDPVSSGQSKAEGTFPHAQGMIHIRWDRHGSRIVARASVPEGVSLVPAAHVDLALD